MIYPWQQQNWHSLLTRHRNNNLPHAMLFIGTSGLGKFTFARYFSQFLLCQGNNGRENPCTKCASCNLFNANTHPDFLLVQPEGEGKTIKIEQIRQMIEEVGSTAHQGGARVVVINKADAMNAAAANALLKTLEEPLGNVVIILVSARPAVLPATIRSRCQKIEFASPAIAEALKWLQQEGVKSSEDDARLALNLAHNAPLQALALLQSDDLTLQRKILTDLLAAWRTKNLQEQTVKALNFAETYADVDNTFLLHLFLSVVSDMLKLQLAVAPTLLTNLGHEQELRATCNNFSCEKLLAYQNYLLELSKAIGNNIALNKQLLLENLFLRLGACT